MENVWAIILAAGASSRMKTQKMLLPYQGKTIIETVIDSARNVVRKNILVVLGSHYEIILEQIRNKTVKHSINFNFMQGMLSSVICGFKSLPENAKAALIFLGDQPQIPSAASKLVAEAWQNSRKGIIIPTFQARRGHPVLIETRYLSEIENLDPEKGLRQLMEKFKNDIFEVECTFPEILRDIDTPREYENEIKNQINV